MKILIVVSDLIVGGITTSAFNFSDEMIKRGHDVTFLDISNTVSENDLPNNEIRILKINGKSRFWNITAKNSNGLSPFKHKILGLIKKVLIRTNMWYKFIFKNYMVDGEFDVAIAFRQCEPCYYFVLNCVKAKKKIGFVHGELRFMGDISSWKKYMTSFNKIAYVSNAVKEQFVSAYPELVTNASVIYNMFNVEKIKRLADEKPAIEFDKTKKNIVTVSRIDNEFKQIEWIPYICANLKKRTNIPFCWYVVGGGVGYSFVNELICKTGTGDVLKLIGEHSNPYSFIKNSDFTVLTSKSESYGLVVCESLILKKPVVVAKYPALCEIMQDGVHGLVAEQSVESITDCVVQMLENAIDIENYPMNNEISYNQFMEAII